MTGVQTCALPICLPLFVISAVTGAGLIELIRGIGRRLEDTGWLRAAS